MLYLDLIHLVRLDDLDIGYGVGQCLPQVGNSDLISHRQAVDVPEVIRTAPAPVSGDDLERTLVCGVAVPLLACRTERR